MYVEVRVKQILQFTVELDLRLRHVQGQLIVSRAYIQGLVSHAYLPETPTGSYFAKTAYSTRLVNRDFSIRIIIIKVQRPLPIYHQR